MNCLKREIKETNDKIIVGHYPSSKSIKGTDEILRMLPENENVIYDINKGSQLEHKELIERLWNCDIYIELYKRTLYGKEYGCWGVTAFEAAALGSLVMTQNLYPEYYMQTYGDFQPFVLCNDKFLEKFNNLIDKISDSVEVLRGMKHELRKKIQRYHSLKATGKLILDTINKI